MGSYESSRQFLEGRYSGRFKWTKPENLHLTWVFLGETPASHVPEILQALKRELSEQETISLTMSRLAPWPHAKPEALVWEGNESLRSTDNHQVYQVAERIRSIFSPAPEEKPFHPHITLARIKGPTNTWEDFPPIPSPFFRQPRIETLRWDINEIHLYQSILLPTGAQYESLGCIDLVAEEIEVPS